MALKRNASQLEQLDDRKFTGNLKILHRLLEVKDKKRESWLIFSWKPKEFP